MCMCACVRLRFTCLSAAEEDDEEEGMLAVLLPPQVEQVGKLLRIQGNINIIM